MKYEFVQPKFSEGVLAKSLQGRSTEEFYKYGLKGAKNMIPILSGPVVKRPGTNYIGSVKHTSSILIPFFKDKDNTYVIEIGSTSPSSGGYLRLWSQDRLLNDKQSTPATYEVTSGVTWTQAQLLTLKYTQSGDYIFVCCPTKEPQIIKRVIQTGGSSAGFAEDDSVWTVYEYIMKDGPYKDINVYSQEGSANDKYSLYKAEPSTKKKVAAVEFNTELNSLVLSNHGLQVGMKIRLDDDGSSSGWGNITSDGAATLTDADYYVTATTATTFQVSTSDGGKPLEFELKSSTTTANATVYLYRYVDLPSDSSAITLTLYRAGAVSNDIFASTDVGRMIRINPLAKPLTRIGGIRWCWGVISDVGTNTIDVYLKTEMCNIRGGVPATTSDETKERGTPDFRLGAFSAGEGFPSVAQIYQQRMVLAATSSQPSTVWLSETNNFYSYAPTELPAQDAPSSVVSGEAIELITATSALTFTLDSDTLDEIKWLAESKKLTLGTSAGVYMLYGSETNLVVTPFRFTINRESSFSATDTPPVVVSNALMYAQIGGKDVQQLLFEGQQGQWFNSKISIKGYDIIKASEIKKMVWQERPNNVIWMMMDDGRLISLSYDRQTSFQAWSEHQIGGSLSSGNAKVVDIEMIATASHDQIWLKIERTINSSTAIYMETIARFPTEGALSRNHYVFSDGALTKSIAGKAFTASSSSGLLITSAGHGLIDTQVINVTNTGGALPTGLLASTNYYVRDKTDDTFKLAIASGGTAIAYTNAGTGTHNWITKQVTGLSHLEGESVQIYYDGMQHINKTVASGSIILDNFSGTDIVLGLAYNGEVETLEPIAPENQYSYSKQVKNLSVLIEESLGIQVEYEDLDEELLFRTSGDLMGEQIDLFSGKRKLSLSGIGWDEFGIKIISNGPFPMQINSIVMETETGGS